MPLYYQIKQRLREQVEEGRLTAGDRVSSERELSEAYGISRMTVRQALTELVHEGLLVREQGRGTFVAQPKLSQGLSSLTSFSEDMRLRDLRPGARLIKLEEVEAGNKVAELLGLGVDRRIVRVERLRLGAGEPMALEVAHLPAQVVPALAQYPLGEGSLYDLLHVRYGLRLQRAVQTLEAALAGPYEAELLGTDPGSPVLVTERVTYLDSGAAIEYAHAFFRADRYKFHTELVR